MQREVRPATVSALLREGKEHIAAAWETVVRRELPQLGRLDRAELFDHLPEVLDALADWVDGDEVRGSRAFSALAHGHALQRLGFGIDLDVLTLEYQHLRTTLLEAAGDIAPTAALFADLVRLNAGLDLAIHAGLKRHSLQRDQLRERFIGILGHDLRGPLQVMQLALNALVHHEALEPALVKVAARGLKSVGRMERMIADVLDFARSHLGEGMPARPTDEDLGEICRSATEELQAAFPGREISVRCDGNLRGRWDRDRTLQAIGNLGANAVAHGADPIVLHAYEQDSRHVVLDVSNGGAPITDAARAHLFDPFRRGTERSTGLGLGLYIVKQIVLAHGGLIDVLSDDTGTTFRVTWPRSQPADIAERA